MPDAAAALALLSETARDPRGYVERWRAAHPGRYVRRRTVSLEGRSAMVVRDGLNFCVK